jgi:hypothetical protein
MAVAGVEIERHIGEHADFGRRILDGADGAANEIIGIERFLRILAAPIGAGVREQGDSRSTDRRDTPGMVPTGVSTSWPSVGNSGQIRLAGDRLVSRCRSRLQAVMRVRRRRVWGNRVMAVDYSARCFLSSMPVMMPVSLAAVVPDCL